MVTSGHVAAACVLLLMLVSAGCARRSRTGATKHGDPHRPELVTAAAAKIIKIDFGGNDTLEKELTESGRYNPKNIVVFDVTPDSSRNRMIVTLPLARRGTPATLATVPVFQDDTQLAKSYPSLDVHRTTEDTITDCPSQLVSVTTTTKKWGDDNMLYVSDSGVLDIISSPKNFCPPKIVVIDLTNNKITKAVEIKNAACGSLYTTIVVEECPAGSLVAYVADARTPQLSVTDLNSGESKHLQSQYFHAVPGYFFTSAGGPLYYFPYGLGAMAVDESCSGKLYFQPYSSPIQGALDKSVIANAKDGDVLDVVTEALIPGPLDGVSGAMAIDPAGELLFFSSQEKRAVYCWNTTKPHNSSNFHMVAKDDQRMQFTSGMKLEKPTGLLWIVTDRLNRFITNTIDNCVLNYYALVLDIKGLKC